MTPQSHGIICTCILDTHFYHLCQHRVGSKAAMGDDRAYLDFGFANSNAEIHPVGYSNTSQSY